MFEKALDTVVKEFEGLVDHVIETVDTVAREALDLLESTQEYVETFKEGFKTGFNEDEKKQEPETVYEPKIGETVRYRTKDDEDDEDWWSAGHEVENVTEDHVYLLDMDYPAYLFKLLKSDNEFKLV